MRSIARRVERVGYFAVLMLLSVALLPMAPAQAAKPPKIDVCHKPGLQTVVRSVGEADLATHLAHGDFVCTGVPCQSSGGCTEGVGACQDSGVTQCVAGDLCSAAPGTPSAELCNAVDDDCDGTVDDDPTDLGTCTAGVGECAVVGDEVCGGGVIACAAVAGDPPEPGEEVTCDDGLDNDCDGSIDLVDSDCDQPTACPCFTLEDLVALSFDTGESLPYCECGVDFEQDLGDGNTIIATGVLIHHAVPGFARCEESGNSTIAAVQINLSGGVETTRSCGVVLVVNGLLQPIVGSFVSLDEYDACRDLAMQAQQQVGCLGPPTPFP